MSVFPKVPEVKTIDKREFSYRMGEVTLRFTLRTDILQELQDFRVLLDRATKDVDATILKTKGV